MLICITIRNLRQRKVMSSRYGHVAYDCSKIYPFMSILTLFDCFYIGNIYKQLGQTSLKMHAKKFIRNLKMKKTFGWWAPF